MLDPRLLRIFIAIAEEGHFGRAAERLAIAQSTLSVQLRRLEDMVGAPLLIRRKRSAVRISDVGRVFLDEAKAALERLDRAEAIGRMAARGQAGPLALGYIFSAALSGVLPQLLRQARSSAPQLQITPRLLETPEQIRAVAERRLDIGLVRPRPNYPAGVHSRIVHSEPLRLLIADAHPLANRDGVAASELADEIFLLPQFNERVGLVEKLEELAMQGGFDRPDPIRTSDFVTAASMAAGGQGVVLGPASLGRLGIEGLRSIPIEGFDEAIETVLIWHEDRSPAVCRIVELFDDPSGEHCRAGRLRP